MLLGQYGRMQRMMRSNVWYNAMVPQTLASLRHQIPRSLVSEAATTRRNLSCRAKSSASTKIHYTRC